jgi:hypothetical protein
MTERTRSLSRRSFMLTLGAATAATAAGAIATRAGPALAPVPVGGKREKKGYQASAHVGRYYRTTRI